MEGDGGGRRQRQRRGRRRRRRRRRRGSEERNLKRRTPTRTRNAPRGHASRTHREDTSTRNDGPPQEAGRSLHAAQGINPPHVLASRYMHRTQSSPNSRRGLHVLLSTGIIKPGSQPLQGNQVPPHAHRSTQQRTLPAHQQPHPNPPPAPARVTSLHLRSCHLRGDSAISPSSQQHTHGSG